MGCTVKLSDLLSSHTSVTSGLDDQLPEIPEDEAGHSWASGLSGWACQACLGNPELFRVFGRGTGGGRECDFCEVSDPTTEFASLDGLVEYLYRCLLSEFDNADTTDIHLKQRLGVPFKGGTQPDGGIADITLPRGPAEHHEHPHRWVDPEGEKPLVVGFKAVTPYYQSAAVHAGTGHGDGKRNETFRSGLHIKGFAGHLPTVDLKPHPGIV